MEQTQFSFFLQQSSKRRDLVEIGQNEISITLRFP